MRHLGEPHVRTDIVTAPLVLQDAKLRPEGAPRKGHGPPLARGAHWRSSGKPELVAPPGPLWLK